MLRQTLARVADGDLPLLAALVVTVIVPQHIVERGPSLCLISRVIGRPCPACGMSRSWVATAHGDIPRALRWNRLGPASFTLAVALVARSAFTYRRRSDTDQASRSYAPSVRNSVNSSDNTSSSSSVEASDHGADGEPARSAASSWSRMAR